MQPLYRFDHLSKAVSLIHGVSQKKSDMPYAFSLALHTGEEREGIVTNRRHLARQLLAADTCVFVVANQTHSDHVRIIDKKVMRGWENLEDAVEDCDALVTNEREVILTILTADCVPILLYDPIKRVVAAVHAGWRGTQAKIVTKTVEVMARRFGSTPWDILAGVAPAIGGCCYEVGEEVASHFLGYPDAIEQHGEKYMLDLPAINKIQMLLAGIQEEHIELSGKCTACDAASFFSYRKEQGCSGRFMSVIGLC